MGLNRKIKPTIKLCICSNAPDMPVPLPAEVSCYLSNTCTGVDCCVQVDKLGLAINAYVLLDTCNNAENKNKI
jgi:hypothetical protein